MICVSIGRGRHQQMIAEHRHLVEQGAGLVELRLDYIDGEVNLKRLLNDRPGPVIVVCRREEDGGKWTGTEEDRLMLLRTAISQGVEYVDLEEDAVAGVPRFGKTKRIVSLHDFRKTPENLDEIHARLAALDADIVKLATMANHPHDNLRMLRLIKQSKTATVGMCMGEVGKPSRLLSGKFGAPFTYATFHEERALAPGQLSYRRMRDIYHYEQIDADTQVYGVIADPIGHSLSPMIHNAMFQHLGLNSVYIPFQVSREDLDQFMSDVVELGIKGLSITIPHKEAIIPRITKVDEAVSGIGAANTIVFDGDKLLGYNTDYRAAMDSLEASIGTAAAGKSLEGKVALLLGAGGVAKAIAFGLKRRGAKVVIASRTAARSQKLAKQFACKAIDWSNRHTVKADVLVNGTPVGMHPNVDESPYDKHYLRPSVIVFDTVYNPESTLLVKEARRKSCTVITGVDMFVRQAALQFQLFTGQDAPMELMRDQLKRATGAAKY